MLFAWQHNPTLFETPPLTLLGLLPLVLRTLGLAFCVSVGALLLGTCLAFAHVRYDYFGNRLLTMLSTFTTGRSIVSSGGPGTRKFRTARRSVLYWGLKALLLDLMPPCWFLFYQPHPTFRFWSQHCSKRQQAPMKRHVPSVSRRGDDFYISPYHVCGHTWAFALVIVAFYVISDFGAAAVLDCEVLTWALYQSRHAPADAMRMGFGLVFCTLPMLGMIRWLHGKQKPVKAISETRTLQRVPLPQALRLPLYLAHGFIIGLGLFLPLWHMTEWLVSGLKYAEQFATLGPTIQTTLIYTLVGAMLTLIAALLPAYTIGHQKHRFNALAEHSVYVTSAVPGILIATGLFFLVINLKQYESLSDFIGLVELSGLFYSSVT